MRAKTAPRRMAVSWVLWTTALGAGAVMLGRGEEIRRKACDAMSVRPHWGAPSPFSRQDLLSGPRQVRQKPWSVQEGPLHAVRGETGL